MHVRMVEDLEGLEFPDPAERKFQIPEWLTPETQLVGRSGTGKEGGSRFRLWLDLAIYWAPTPRFRPWLLKGEPFILEHVPSGLPLGAFKSYADLLRWIDADDFRAEVALHVWELLNGAPEVDSEAPMRGTGPR